MCNLYPHEHPLARNGGGRCLEMRIKELQSANNDLTVRCRELHAELVYLREELAASKDSVRDLEDANKSLKEMAQL